MNTFQQQHLPSADACNGQAADGVMGGSGLELCKKLNGAQGDRVIATDFEKGLSE